MGGDHIAFAPGQAGAGGRPIAGGVLDELDAADLSITVHLHAAGHALVEDAHVAGVQRLVHGHRGIVLGLDRTDRRAAGVAGADPPAVVVLRVAPGRRRADQQRQALERLAIHRGSQPLIHQ
ncbi:hypothetical protein D3C84_921970 [compost metagenome]